MYIALLFIYIYIFSSFNTKKYSCIALSALSYSFKSYRIRVCFLNKFLQQIYFFLSLLFFFFFYFFNTAKIYKNNTFYYFIEINSSVFFIGFLFSPCLKIKKFYNCLSLRIFLFFSYV